MESGYHVGTPWDDVFFSFSFLKEKKTEKKQKKKKR